MHRTPSAPPLHRRWLCDKGLSLFMNHQSSDNMSFLPVNSDSSSHNHYCPPPPRLFKRPLFMTKSHHIEIIRMMSHCEQILAQDAFLSLCLYYTDYLGTGSSALFTFITLSFLLDCSNFILCASLRLDPHRLVSLPPVHPLLSLHLCSLHRRYDVTADFPISSEYILCMVCTSSRTAYTSLLPTSIITSHLLCLLLYYLDYLHC